MKNFLKFAVALVLIAMVSGSLNAQDDLFVALKTNPEITLNGIADEPIWEACDWYPLSYVWIPYGQTVAADDFTGQFKVAWDENFIYFLVEVTDDSLYDGHTDPLANYWDDDCVEIFLDEDKSGGNHQNNFNAFAYHVGIFLDAVDFNTSGPALFNDDVDVNYTKNGDIYTWELAMKIFDDSYVYGANNIPVTLNHGKELGFSLAYCDNDGSASRENFIGSKYLPQSQANNGYITADVFGTLNLIDTAHISILKNPMNSLLNIYPTIAHNELTINLENYIESPIKLSIQNNLGIKLIENLYLTGKEFTLNLEQLNPGNYFIVANFDGKQTINMFIKMN